MTPLPRRMLALLVLAGCKPVQPPPGGWATLPPDAVVGAGDPTRAAIISAAGVFGNTASVAGNPAAAARAVANYEYLAVEIPTGPRWRGFNPAVSTELLEGRKELRAVRGIAPDAPTQPLIEAFYAASRALVVGNQAAAEQALSGPNFPAGSAVTMAKLNALPRVPRAAAATSMAALELDRQSMQDMGRRGGGGSSRP